MLPSRHAILGLIASLMLLCIFPELTYFGAAIIFASSVLIDADHYLYYVCKKKDLSLKRAYLWFITNRDIFFRLSEKEREKMETALILFHGIECWILLALLMLWHYFFGFILIGFLIHMIFDFIELHVHKIPHHTKLSQIYTHKKNKKAE